MPLTFRQPHIRTPLPIKAAFRATLLQDGATGRQIWLPGSSDSPGGS
jgi:hypothetical protein